MDKIINEMEKTPVMDPNTYENWVSNMMEFQITDKKDGLSN